MFSLRQVLLNLWVEVSSSLTATEFMFGWFIRSAPLSISSRRLKRHLKKDTQCAEELKVKKCFLEIRTALKVMSGAHELIIK